MVEPVSKAAKQRTLRKPTGQPSWPVLLLAGREKSGKSYQAALASSSTLIDRTFWVGFGEKDPDEYGAIAGARFEIAPHDGTLADLAETIRYLLTIDEGEKPHLLVIDSGTRIWDTLKDKATYLATARGSRDKNGEVVVGTDLWNKVGGEWKQILGLLRQWRGPVIVTARLDTVAVISHGRPTGEQTEKIQGHKSLPYDVDAIVEMPERGSAVLTGARSVLYNLDGRKELGKEFTVDWLWRKLGLDHLSVSQPTYTEPESPKRGSDGEASDSRG